MKKIICITIPIFNNQNSIEELYQRLRKILKKIENVDYKFIFVDDSSTDNSKIILKEVCKSDPNVTAIFLSNNFGQAAALCAGFDNSNGDYFGVLDADLEDPPEILHDMMNYLIEDKFDIIVAERISTKVNIFRKIASKLTYFVFKIAFRNAPKNGFNVWLMNKKMFSQFSKITNGFFQYDIYELGFRRKIISYERQPSKNIKSKQNILKLFTIFFEITIKSSEIFFKYIFIIGFFIFLCSVANFFYMIFEYLNNPGKNPKGLYAVLTYISFFGSLNLLFLGIIGNYLLKIIKNNSKHKKYYIEEIINNSK
jgi:glycosyltransferase involved in cell wall biosynthesis